MIPTTATPIPVTDRSDVLDALRGFALLGICLANAAVLSLYVFLPLGQKEAMSTHMADIGLTWFHFIFIDGKFYSLFSLLFGIGFSIILLRNEQAGRNPLPVFYRRLFVLAVIGLAHLLLLWEGDILLLYALLGMLLPLFRKVSDRNLLILAAVLILSPIIFDIVKVITNNRWNIAAPIREAAIASDNRIGITEENFFKWLIIHDGVNDLLKWNQSGFFWRWEMLLNSNRLPKVFGMFLVGLFVGRNLIYRNLEQNRSLLKSVQRWGFLIGLPCSIAYAYFELDDSHLPGLLGLADTIFYACSVVPLSMAYTSSFCLLWLNPGWQNKLKIFAPAGRMALTNYLAQTLFGILVYYGIGLGYGTTVGPAIFFPLAFAFYVLQVLYSKAWLSAFRFGPVEWIWRQLTYGKRLPLLKEKK